MTKKVVIVQGSFRKGSFNKQLADYIATVLQEKGVTVSFLNYKQVPLLEQDTEFPTPVSVEAVRAEVAQADGVWVVSPEYNGSYPALVKNVFDWLSRPAKPFDFATPTVIAGKPVTVSAAAGSTAGKFVRANLQTLLAYVRMNVLAGEGVGVQLPASAWQTGEIGLSDEQKAELTAQVDAFIAFLNK